LAKPLLPFLLALLACAPRKPPEGLFQLEGPRQESLKLWRMSAEADKVFVEATLPDGKSRLFLVDTGAAVSALSQSVADALKIEAVATGGMLVGVGGSTPWREAEVASLQVGGFTLRPQRFAVGVAGVPETVGPIPIAGILGNDVWSQFTLVVDYPAGTLTLARPGAVLLPDTATPLFYNGAHAGVPIHLQTGATADSPALGTYLEVDTGARGLVLSGRTFDPLLPAATEGVELMLGVGADSEVPLANFITPTRRVKVQRVELGGQTLDGPFTARWINYKPGRSAIGPSQMTGLVGYEVLADHRVIIDYVGRKFALVPSEGKPALHDLHDWGLEQTKGARTPDEVHRRVEILADLDRDAEALSTLTRWRADHPEDLDATVMEVRLRRDQGELEAALTLSLGLSPAELVDHGEIIAATNSLWLSGRADQARTLAEAAVAARPEAGEAWVALADIRRAQGDPKGARAALLTANRKEENPDGHLLRRAWIAAEEGDTYASLTHLRRLLELYPNGGVAPWLYALVVQGGPDVALLRADLARFEARLHPEDLPFDFLAAAYWQVGDPARAAALRATGEARDCTKAPDPASAANCEAWYRALAHQELDAAQLRIDTALKEGPNRSQYRDTQAVVLEARGQLGPARDAAFAAARLQPDDVYLLWQAARLDRRAKAGR
jgi:tetratricopeptide (TPR) repeat protein